MLANEAELKEYRDQLEKKVTERTDELVRTNQRLQAEIENRIIIETENREAQKNEKRYQEQLFQAAKMTSLGTLVAGVAHEINNPVAAIMLNAPVLKKISESAAVVMDEYYGQVDDFKIGTMRYSELRQKVPVLIDSIGEAAERIKTIINDLKDYSRESILEMNDPVDINTVTEKAIGLVHNLIKKSTHNFDVFTCDSPPTFTGNAVKIEQVIINLLINACQALPDLHAGISVKTFSEEETGRVGVTVIDQGGGISADILSRIKDPFFTTRRDNGGTGLGLSISDRIIREHNGTLEFISEPCMGVEVKASFPACSISSDMGKHNNEGY